MRDKTAHIPRTKPVDDLPTIEIPATNTDTKVEVANNEEDLHRRSFLEASFGPKSTSSFSNSKTGHRQAILSHDEYNNHLKIVRYWNLVEGHVDSESGKHISQHEFRRSVGRSWYQNIQVFQINTTTNTDGSISEFLERKDAKSKSWKRVVHIDNVFDAIKECHGYEEHRCIAQTKTEVEKTYWNITENLCRYFVQSCPRCIKKRSKDKTPTTSKKEVTHNEFLDRYIVRLIDYRNNPQKDLYDIPMSYVLLVHDNVTKGTVLRPITKPEHRIIENELMTIICIQGLHRSSHSNTLLLAAKSLATITLTRHDALTDRTKVQAHNPPPEEIDVEPLVTEAKRHITEHANTIWDIGDNNQNWVTALNHAMISMNHLIGTNRAPLSLLTIPSMISSQPNIEGELPTDAKVNSTRTPMSTNATTPTELRNNTSTDPNNNDIMILSQQSTISTCVRNLDQDMSQNRTTSLDENRSLDTHPQADTSASVRSSSSLVDKELVIKATDGTNTMDTAVLPTLETDPPTQSTLSQIDSLMENDHLATQVKQTYLSDCLDIRSFFNNKQTDATDTPDDPDEVQEVSPPPKQEGENDCQFSVTTHARYSINEAFARGKTTTIEIDGTCYRLCHPRLVCETCNRHVPPLAITAAEDQYYQRNLEEHQWFFPDIVTTFGILCSHDAHRDDMIYADATLPSVVPDFSKKKILPLPKQVHTIVSVVFNQRHYAVMRLRLDERRAYIYDGMAKSMDNWKPHMKYILNKYGIQGQKWQIGPGTGNDGMDGIEIEQKDQSNCGPIACMVLWKLFKEEAINLQNINPADFREMSIREVRRLLVEHDHSLVLFKRRTRIRASDNTSTFTTSAPETKSTMPPPIQSPDVGGSEVTGIELPASSLPPKYKEHPTSVVEESAPTPMELSHITKAKQSHSTDSKKRPHDDSTQIKIFPTPPTRRSKRIKAHQVNDAESDYDNGLLDTDEETPQEKEHIRNYPSSESKSKGNKTSGIPSSDDDDGEREFEDPLDGGTAAPIYSAIEKETETTARPLSRLTRGGKVYDGLSSSDDNDETKTTKKPKKRTTAPRKKGQKPPLFVGGMPDFEKPRIKIALPKVKIPKESKCNCQKGCNNNCGCHKNHHKCGVACACNGKCRNS